MKMNNKNIATLATKALLYEVSISPKAGLVSRLSNGSHKDMNFYTFIDSSLALHNYFLNCFDYGQENLFSCPDFFKNLRELGKVAEKESMKLQRVSTLIRELFFLWGFYLLF
jgi:ATP:dephospho-coA triphosphoribosyl transferase